MTIKKGLLTVDMHTCDISNAIVAAMEYIKGDESLLEYLMSHRTNEIVKSSKIFAKFLSQCKSHGIHQLRLRLPQSIMRYLSTLSGKERDLLEATIANYYSYDKKWYQDEEFLGQSIAAQKRRYKQLDDIGRAKAQELFGQGISLKEIGIELGVSEATISRLFTKRWIRRAFIGDSRTEGLFSIR